jgi:hypothetical protein
MNAPQSESISAIAEFPVRTALYRVRRGVEFMDASGQVLRKTGERTWNAKQRRHVAQVICSLYKPAGTRLMLEGKQLVAVRSYPKGVA